MKNLNYYFLSALAIFFLSLAYMTHQQRGGIITNQDACNEELQETAMMNNIMGAAPAAVHLGEQVPQNQDVENTAEETQEAPKPTIVAAKRVPKNPFKEKKYQDTVAIITGKMLGKKDRRIKFKPLVNELASTESQRISVKDDKTFEGEIVLKESGYYKMYYRSKKYLVYLTPGDKLDITFDPESDDKIVYGGTSAGINTYLLRKDQYDDDNSLARRELYKMPYNEFKDSVEVERKIKEDYLFSYIKNIDEVPAKFVGYEMADIEMEWANQYLDYKKLHPKYAPSDYESMDRFNYNFVKELNLRNSHLLVLKSFEDFIEDYFDMKADPKVDAQVPASLSGAVISERHRIKYDYIKEQFSSSAVRDYLRTKVVLSLIGEDGTPTMNPLIMQFRSDVKNKDYRKLVNDKYVKYAMIDDGSLAPDFEGVTIDGRVVRLSDFEGKYLYIDVWATWCGPCKHELPYFEILKEEYRGRNIEFISVSIDKSRFAWENMVREKNMQGHQLFVNGDFDSNFAALYSVKAVPQFILIDPQGQIIDLTARHPSGRVREDLAMLNL